MKRYMSELHNTVYRYIKNDDNYMCYTRVSYHLQIRTTCLK